MARRHEGESERLRVPPPLIKHRIASGRGAMEQPNVTNDGEILLRSPTQMMGYLGDEDSPIDDEGWLQTGDLGHVDDDGYLWITGRSKDLIIRGGENIAPASVERALMSVRGVVEVAVIGVPHSELGEEVAAFIVTENEQLSTDELVAGLRGSIASFAIPSKWHLQREHLPTNHTHKVDKNALVAIASTIEWEPKVSS